MYALSFSQSSKAELKRIVLRGKPPLHVHNPKRLNCPTVGKGHFIVGNVARSRKVGGWTALVRTDDRGRITEVIS